MATTAEELLVKLRSDGAGEVTDSIGQVNEGLEETSNQVGETGDQLQGFRRSFAGAIGAAVSAIAIGIGALASQLPIAGEVASGFAAILEALLFQVDQLARQLGAGGLAGAAYEVSNIIYGLEGVMGDIAGAFTVLGTVAASAAAGVGLVIAKVSGLSALFGSIVAVGGVLVNVLIGIGSVIAGLSASTAIAVAALAALAVGLITNFRGMRDKAIQLIGTIINTVVTGFLSLTNRALNVLGTLSKRVINTFMGLLSDLQSWAVNIASNAYNWGRNIMTSLISGVQSAINRLRTILGNIETAIESRIGVDIGGGGGGTNTTTTTNGFGGGGGSSSVFEIDGRRVDEQTGRYGRGTTTRRGI